MLQGRYRSAALAAAVILSCTVPWGQASAAEEQPVSVQAVHKQQNINFYFQSFTTFYSCMGLENKVERVLRALGADAKVMVRSVDCPSSVARMPYVSIDVTSPVEATPEALAELQNDKNKSTRELAARVKGERIDSDVIEQFPAQWQRVSMTRRDLDLQPGDCELVQELRRKVLPKLAVRIVKDNLTCSPNQVSLSPPRLEVEALVQPPSPDAKGPARQKSQG